LHATGGPDLPVEALDAAMERIGVVVDGKLVLLAVQCEAAACDAVRIAAGDTAEVGAQGDVVVEVVEAQRDVGEGAVPVRDRDGLEDTAVGQDGDLYSVGVGESIELNGLTVQLPERFGASRHRRCSWRGL